MNLDLTVLENNIKYEFNNKGLLRTALIHSSYAHEHNLKEDNERLELLGDAVIHLALTEFVMQLYPNEKEGSLSALRSYCESEYFLSECAKSIQLGDFIYLGKGEAQGGGRSKESLLADTYEAVIAAIHMDAGFKNSRKIFLLHSQEHVQEAYEEKLYTDSKSELQKYTQKHFNTLPRYEIVEEQGKEHNKLFTVTASADGLTFSGKGKTKKNAEKNAAIKLLKALMEK